MSNKTYIYKYQITPTSGFSDYCIVEMAIGANILKVFEQDGNICIWAEVQPTNKPEDRYFKVIPTGGEIPEQMGSDFKYLDSVFIDWLVFHVYEVV